MCGFYFRQLAISWFVVRMAIIGRHRIDMLIPRLPLLEVLDATNSVILILPDLRGVLGYLKESMDTKWRL